MKTINASNIHRLRTDIAHRIKQAGAAGLPLKDLDAVDAYLSALVCAVGNAAVKNTPAGVRLVWLAQPARGLTIIEAA